MKVNYCSWVNGNYKPKNKAKIFYCINAGTLLQLSSYLRLPKLV